METVSKRTNDDFMSVAQDLLARSERRQAAALDRYQESAIPDERECLPCLIEDQD